MADDLGVQLKQAMQELNKLKDCERQLCGSGSEHLLRGRLAEVQESIDQLRLQGREAKPIGQRLRDLESFVARREKEAAKEQRKVDELQKGVDDVLEKLHVQEANAAEALEELTKARGELAEVKGKLAQEHQVETGHAHPGGQAPSGYIAIAEAERAWRQPDRTSE